MTSHWVSVTCGGECTVDNCHEPATHKLGEEIPNDEPCPACNGTWKEIHYSEFTTARPTTCDHVFHSVLGAPRHNLTAYVCCGHFKMIVGRAAPCDETHRDKAVAAFTMVESMIAMLAATADESAARNYVGVNIEGLRAPFARAYIEFVRPGGRTSQEVVEELKIWRRSIGAKLRAIARPLEDHDDPAFRVVAEKINVVLTRFGEITNP